uniref:Uncharacterized protein n=1 Tax=Onchocerca volvulus TaxID=6282 RepID=A0A8R1XTV1_ONCVO
MWTKKKKRYPSCNCKKTTLAIAFNLFPIKKSCKDVESLQNEEHSDRSLKIMMNNDHGQLSATNC